MTHIDSIKLQREFLRKISSKNFSICSKFDEFDPKKFEKLKFSAHEILRCAHAFENSFLMPVSLNIVWCLICFFFAFKVRQRRLKITNIPSDIWTSSIFEFIGNESQIFENLKGICKFINKLMLTNFRCFQIYFSWDSKTTTYVNYPAPAKFILEKCVNSNSIVIRMQITWNQIPKHWLPKSISISTLIEFLQKESNLKHYSNSVQKKASDEKIDNIRIQSLFKENSILERMGQIIMITDILIWIWIQKWIHNPIEFRWKQDFFSYIGMLGNEQLDFFTKFRNFVFDLTQETIKKMDKNEIFDHE